MYNLKKKTKIICTIGPASDNKETLTKLLEAGMCCMRINLSHGNHEEHLMKINLLREIERERKICVPIMLDTKGPEIRTHDFVGGSAVIKDKSIVRVCMDKILGTAEKFSVTFPLLFDDLDIGKSIRLDDGKLELIVKEKDYENKELICEAQNTHKIKDKRGVNVPGVHVSMPFISEKDKNDIIFAANCDVDLIAASFVRNRNDIIEIKKILADAGKPNIKILAKIENQEALDDLDNIIDEADALMVARGDLGVEVPAEDVPMIQRMLIEKCRAVGKPIVTATQMLDSMVSNPNPTRAEVSDVATAVVESCDCVMLSGESANGLYPVEAVQMQAKIAANMEKYLNYQEMAKEAY